MIIPIFYLEVKEQYLIAPEKQIKPKIINMITLIKKRYNKIL